MSGEMFDGLSPEVKNLLEVAGSDLPTAQADAGLLRSMAQAVALGGTLDALNPNPRRRSMLGKALTAKAAAIVGVLVMTGGVASAATGALPDPAQNAASHAAEHVGLHIPKSDDDESDATEDADDEVTEVEHPDNHGKDVSTVAHDKSNEGRDHGAAVCEVASDGKCKAGEDKSGTDKGKSADHRQDGDHRGSGDDDEVTTPGETTTTTVDDDANETDEADDDGAGHGHHSGSDDSGSDDSGSDDSGSGD